MCFECFIWCFFRVRRRTTKKKSIVAIASVVCLLLGTASFGVWADPPSWDLLDADFGTVDGDSFVTGGSAVFTEVVDFEVSETQTATTSSLVGLGTPPWGGVEGRVEVSPGVGAAYTVEIGGFSMSVDGRYDMELTSPIGFNSFYLGWHEDDRAFFHAADDNWWGTDDAALMPDRTEVHTYRVVVDGGFADLYIDSGEVPIIADEPLEDNSTSDNYLFRIIGRTEPSAVPIFDYVKIASGAYGPLPNVGDVDGNGLVGRQDVTTILGNAGMTGTYGVDIFREDGDLDADGDVDADDLQIVQDNWGAGYPTEPPSGIPEPATLGLLLMGGAALLKRRR